MTALWVLLALAVGGVVGFAFGFYMGDTGARMEAADVFRLHNAARLPMPEDWAR